MLDKLRKNFGLCSVLTDVAFLVAYSFGNWQTTYQLLQSGVLFTGFNFTKSNTTLFAIPTMLIGGVITLLLLKWLCRILLTSCGFFSVPKREYTLIATLFAGGYHFAMGLVNLIGLFTPLASVWISTIVPFVLTAVALFAFYKVTANLYFNDVTKANYVNRLFVVFAVFCAIQIINALSAIISVTTGGAVL